MKVYKNILEIIIWILITLYLILVLGFVSDQDSDIRCKGIEVKIIDKTNNQFVESNDIISMFKSHELKTLGYPFDSLQLDKMEELTRKEQHSVRNTEIYHTSDGILHVDLTQRNPILRIINKDNTGYYIDDEGALMRLNDKYSANVLIANGNIYQPYDLRYTTNVSEAIENNEQNGSKLLFDLYTLADFIYKDHFWKAQIQQIYVTKNNEFELVPKVGEHIIEFGTIENYKKKFRNLMQMYTKGLRAEGWNKYEIINLKYKNQVVCSKKEIL